MPEPTAPPPASSQQCLTRTWACNDTPCGVGSFQRFRIELAAIRRGPPGWPVTDGAVSRPICRRPAASGTGDASERALHRCRRADRHPPRLGQRPFTYGRSQLRGNQPATESTTVTDSDESDSFNIFDVLTEAMSGFATQTTNMCAMTRRRGGDAAMVRRSGRHRSWGSAGAAPPPSRRCRCRRVTRSDRHRSASSGLRVTSRRLQGRPNHLRSKAEPVQPRTVHSGRGFRSHVNRARLFDLSCVYTAASRRRRRAHSTAPRYHTHRGG